MAWAPIFHGKTRGDAANGQGLKVRLQSRVQSAKTGVARG